MVRRIFLAAVMAFSLSGAVFAQQTGETWNLTVPESLGTRTGWSKVAFRVEFGPGITTVIDAEVTDNLGNISTRDHHDANTTPTGDALWNLLNTANFAAATCPGVPTNKCSFAARLFKHLQNEGKIAAGSITGTPQ